MESEKVAVPNDIDPTEALDSIRAARAEVVKTLDYPAWWDIQYGFVVGAMVTGQGLPQPWSSLVLLATLGGLFWMIGSWKRRFGWWVNGYAPKRARRVAWGLAALLILCMGLALWTRFFDGPWWAPVAAGVAAFVISIIFGRWWMRVFRKDLEAGDL